MTGEVGPTHLGFARRSSVMAANGRNIRATCSVEQRHHIVKNPFGVDDEIFRLDGTNQSECKGKAFQWPLRAHEPQFQV
jgi:hypothetical protein